jgi:inorganic triphosphatase YgiF
MSTAPGGAKVDKGGNEVELKLRVDDLACLFRIAIASGSVPAVTVVQSNNYVDTEDGALDRAKMVLRLRAESTATSWQGFVTATSSTAS